LTTAPRTTPHGESAIDGAIAEIRRITSEENVEQFSNDELLDACIQLTHACDAAPENGRDDIPSDAADFCAALDAARHRATSYDDRERSIITRAINRANRSLAYR